jgi:TPR repeat protein
MGFGPVGEGVPRDHAKAAYWHTKSIKMKNYADVTRD